MSTTEPDLALSIIYVNKVFLYLVVVFKLCLFLVTSTPANHTVGLTSWDCSW